MPTFLKRPPRMHSILPRIIRRNKRTALNAAIVFLGLNGFDVVDKDGRLYDAMMSVAIGKLSKGQMAALLEQVSESWRDDD